MRFLLVGGTNTLITGLLVVILSYLMPGWLAFTVSFALGLLFSVLVTGSWVFGSRLTLRRAALFGASYLAIYGIGLTFVSVMHVVGAPAWVNGASVLITAPLSFLAGKFIFVDSQPAPTAEAHVQPTEANPT